MPDPITLAVVGTVVVTEGVKFLYNQAGELLKYWRERKKATTVVAQNETQPTEVKLPAAFEGQLSTPKIHLQVLGRVEDNLRNIRKDLSDYAEGLEDIDPGNEILLAKVDALRQLLEAVYQQRITFKDEKRPPSGPTVEGKIDVGQVEGYATAVRAKKITGGKVKAEANADIVKPGGTLTAVDADTIGVEPAAINEKGDAD